MVEYRDEYVNAMWQTHYRLATQRMTDYHFPTWSVTVLWDQLCTDGKRGPNSICPIIMQEHQHGDRAAVQRQAWEFWRETADGPRNRDCNPVLKGFSIRFRGWNQWCLSWFDHWTYPLGRTDHELLQSFQQHVEEKQAENRRLEARGYWGDRGPFDENYLLMGAGDRYRRSDVCRCVHCGERGIVRISH